ncbi:MAG: Translation initiation factor IF-3 [Phycisphaerae bacterium]|nr:Translation initiation factor IF-3 [Phycisphaerae bacterium]
MIDALNNQLGIMATGEALRRAREAGLDLVEVAPMDRPPVCRIMDYGKWKYQLKKKQKKHHEQQLKEIRLRPRTDDHDREIKVKHALDFLRKGDKVQFTMVFRGRERSHREIGQEFFNDILTDIGAYVKVERPPLMEGRNLIMIVAPNKAALDKLPASAAAAPPATGATAAAGGAPAVRTAAVSDPAPGAATAAPSAGSAAVAASSSVSAAVAANPSTGGAAPGPTAPQA